MSGQICKYFLSKGCRYGDRCRFIHEYPEEEYGTEYESRYASRNPYVYLSDDYQRSGARSGPQPQKNLITEIVAHLAQEVKQIERSGMWPLTVIGYANHGNIPGWKDYSPEEIRWANYLAAGNGSLQKFMQDWMSLLRKAAENRKMFTSPTKQTVEIVKQMIDKKLNTESSNSKNQTFSTTSSFSSPITNMQRDPAPGLFSQVPKQNPSSSFNQPLFSKFSTPPSQSFFGNSNQPGGFGQPSGFSSVFANQPSVFGSSNNPPIDDQQMQECEFDEPKQNVGASQSTFGQQTPNIEKNIFGQVPSMIPFSMSTTFENKPVQSIFSSSVSEQSETFKSKIYSKMSDLTEEEIEQFKAQTFTYQNVPLKPPPKELCVP